MYYIHVLAHVYSTRASTCVYYTCLESKWSLFTRPFLQLQEYTSKNSVCPPLLQHFQSKVGTQKKIPNSKYTSPERENSSHFWKCQPEFSEFLISFKRLNLTILLSHNMIWIYLHLRLRVIRKWIGGRQEKFQWLFTFPLFILCLVSKTEAAREVVLNWSDGQQSWCWFDGSQMQPVWIYFLSRGIS